MTEESKGKTSGISGPATVSSKLRRIANLTKEDPKRVLTSLSYHVDKEWLEEAVSRTRKDGAKGVDGQTAGEYAENLDENLRSLLERFKSGSYKAPPVRRVEIPKAGGKTRPIGIPTYEDKILQRAVTMVLEAVYEQDFLDCSYGFRPGRSAHQALGSLWKQTMDMGGGWVLDADIKGFFDNLDHRHLRAFLDRRVRDGVLRRVIHKWLKAGVLSEGNVKYPKGGTPQGGVISPILANIYLHEVLDVWFEEQVKPVLQGRAFVVRFADDFVIVFSDESDARRVLEVLPNRFGKYGLSLHPEKTRLVPFRRPRKGKGNDDDDHPGTFEFLGFTHYWGKSRKGNPVIGKKTAASRFQRTLGSIGEWLRKVMHLPLREQHKGLWLKLKGYDAYYGITGNGRSLQSLRFHVKDLWRRTLSRRSQKGYVNWDRMNRILKGYPLPAAKVVHSVYRS